MKKSAKSREAKIKERLEYLRGEIIAERISYGEIAELQSLVDYIDPDDVQLLEWAGVPEGETPKKPCRLRRYVKHRLVSSQIFDDPEAAHEEGRKWANADGNNTFSVTEAKRVRV